MTHSPLTSHPRGGYTLLAVLLTVALLFRAVSIGYSGGFWLDEIFAASFVNLNLFDLVVAVMRFDVHPPLYYAQLKLWSLPFGNSDNALHANTLLWSLLGLLIGFRYLREKYGISTALCFVALLGAFGNELYYVAELRMYCMVGTLVLLALGVADDFRSTRSRRDGIRLAVLLSIIGMCHSAAIVPVSALLWYVSPIEDRRLKPAFIRGWIAICLVVAVMMLPWLINASIRNVGHIRTPSLESFFSILGGFAVGYHKEVPEIVRQVLGVPVLGGLLFCLASARTSRIALTLIVWPFVATAIISLLYKPMWYYREYAFVGGMVALVFAINLGARFDALVTRPRLRNVAVVSAASVLAVLATFNMKTATDERLSVYIDAARFLERDVAAGEVIYIPDNRSFWGIARYLIGPGWGNLLEIQDPVDQDRSAKWPSIYQKLGETWMRRLHLQADTRRLDGFRAPIFVGWSALPELKDLQSYWLVTNNTRLDYDMPTETPCLDESDPRYQLRGFDVVHVRCAADDVPPASTEQQ